METSRIKLKPKTKSLLKEWLFIFLAFSFMMYLYYFVTWWGLGYYLKPSIYDNYLDSGWGYFEIGAQALFFSIMFGIVNLLLERSNLAKRSIGIIILIKTSLYTIAILLSQYAVYLLYRITKVVPEDQMLEMQQQMDIRFMISMSVYFIFVVLLINFLIQINKKIGYGILLSMITGKYLKPRKENRIFMFLDMKNSTGNVEKLGHLQYSRLIQSCIHELNDLIPRYKAEVYQYVGDEIVLTWPTEKGLKDLNCINLYYTFKQKLEDRRTYYEKNYGVFPEFKAGLAEGSITVTEVGDIKRELAYHGEALHTAARLEKMCNKLEKKVLITENILSKLPGKNGYQIKLMGEYQLKGKEGKDKVYGIAF